MTFVFDRFWSQVVLDKIVIAGGGNRTLASSLGSSQATITSRPLMS